VSLDGLAFEENTFSDLECVGYGPENLPGVFRTGLLCINLDAVHSTTPKCKLQTPEPHNSYLTTPPLNLVSKRAFADQF